MDAILCSEAEKQARARKKGCDKPPPLTLTNPAIRVKNAEKRVQLFFKRRIHTSCGRILHDVFSARHCG